MPFFNPGQNTGYGTHSHLNKLAPRMARKAGLIGNNLRNWTGGVRQRDDLGPRAWNCHLHPSLRFSALSKHLIHAFLAVTSLGNLCTPKLLHLGTQHSVPRLFFASVVNAAHCNASTG